MAQALKLYTTDVAFIHGLKNSIVQESLLDLLFQ